MQTLDPEGAVAIGAKDAWELMTLILEGLERLAMHRDKMVEGQRFGRQVEHWLALKTCC